MAGTKIGGKLTAQTMKARDPDYYRHIGQLGGLKSTGGGFATMSKEKIREAGRKGGSRSKRTNIKGGKGKAAQQQRTAPAILTNPYSTTMHKLEREQQKLRDKSLKKLQELDAIREERREIEQQMAELEASK
jgi:general stress protein YciG